MEKGSYRSEHFHQLQFPSAKSVTRSTSHFKTSRPFGRHRITKNPIHIDHEIILRHQMWLKNGLLIYIFQKCTSFYFTPFVRTCPHTARSKANKKALRDAYLSTALIKISPGTTLHKVSLTTQLLWTRTSTKSELLARKTNMDWLNFPVLQAPVVV